MLNERCLIVFVDEDVEILKDKDGAYIIFNCEALAHEYAKAQGFEKYQLICFPDVGCLDLSRQE